jgi:anthranilate synthase component 1
VSDTLTPISIFAALRGKGASFLLESVENGANWGRYSIIMLESEGSIVLRDGRLAASGRLRDSVTDPRPIEAVRQALAAFELCPADGLPPFAGGLAGYFGYDCLRYYERLPDTPPDPVGFPDAHLCLFTHVLVYDHLSSAARYIRLVNEQEIGESGEDAVRGRMEALLRGLERTPPPGPSAIGVTAYTAAESMGRAAYEDAVRRILPTSARATFFRRCLLAVSRCGRPPTLSRSTGGCAASIRLLTCISWISAAIRS